MQLINIMDSSEPGVFFYRTFHDRNGTYLEREGDAGKFLILWNVDDASNTVLTKSSDFINLLKDIEIVLAEADSNGDFEISNHLKEIFVLCKFCLWNEGRFFLEFTPWGCLLESYPSIIPEKYRFNISEL